MPGRADKAVAFFRETRSLRSFFTGLPLQWKLAAVTTALLLALAGAEALANNRVLAVTDGDSLTVYAGFGKRLRVRLYGIDCPEAGQDSGPEAKAFCRRLALFRRVKTVVLYEDQYRRSVALVTLPDGRVLNAELVRNGHAWVYPQYCKAEQCRDWKRFETRAREQKLGLWRNGGPQPPWVWRKTRPRR